MRAFALDTKKTFKEPLQFNQWVHTKLLAESDFISVKIQQDHVASATGSKICKRKRQHDYSKVRLEEKEDNSTEMALSSYLSMFYLPPHDRLIPDEGKTEWPGNVLFFTTS